MVTDTTQRHRGSTFWNWTAALLALLASVAVVVFAYMQVLGTAGCANGSCDGYGPDPTTFGLIQYGTPVVGVLAVLVSFVTAKRRWGFVVPLLAWVVVLTAAATLVVTF